MSYSAVMYNICCTNYGIPPKKLAIKDIRDTNIVLTTIGAICPGMGNGTTCNPGGPTCLRQCKGDVTPGECVAWGGERTDASLDGPTLRRFDRPTH